MCKLQLDLSFTLNTSFRLLADVALIKLVFIEIDVMKFARFVLHLKTYSFLCSYNTHVGSHSYRCCLPGSRPSRRKTDRSGQKMVSCTSTNLAPRWVSPHSPFFFSIPPLAPPSCYRRLHLLALFLSASFKGALPHERIARLPYDAAIKNHNLSPPS